VLDVLLNRFLVVTNGNNDEEHEQSACGVDNINQGSSIINSARFNYMRTKIESDSVENNDIETNFIDPAKQNVSSATITGMSWLTMLEIWFFSHISSLLSC
jgi:hypothetical protein